MRFPREEDADMFDVVERAIIGHPRSQQSRIGPSGIGDPCDRSLVHALAGDRAPRRPYTGWKPVIGTAGHSWMEAAFIAENRRLGYTRWMTEQRVLVGHIANVPLTGQMDLFDLFKREVIDFKFVGPSMLKKYRSNGPSPQYRVQAHAYGQGMANCGLEPTTVGIMFLPRDGELSGSYVWREPFDATVVSAALERADGFAVRLRDNYNGDVAAMTEGWESCDSPWCDWCPIAAPVSMFDGGI